MKQKVLTEECLVEKYERTHPKSQKWHKRALQSFAGNGATHSARVFDPFRPYIIHAKGSRKWDVDGNEYIDYVVGHGALILGHSHPEVVKAVEKQVSKGLHYGDNHELEIEWAELIKQMMPVAERVEFFACGQEANLMSIILCRAFTGRVKILRFEDNYHGWAGEVAPINAIGTYLPAVKVLPMHDLDQVEKELATKEYAICMIEGGGAHMAGQAPWNYEFVRTLSSLTRKYGTVFHIDEVVTGFRESRGGWQELVGVSPDTTTLGKCVSGGMPSGVLIGRADIFDAFNPKRPPAKRVIHSGTWNANPVSSAAGIAACKLYTSGEPQRKAVQIGAYLREKGNEVLEKLGIDARLYGRTVIHIYLGPIEYEPTEVYLPPSKDFHKIINPAMTPIRLKLCLALLQHGIATIGGRFFAMTAAHTEHDVDETIDAFKASLTNLMAEGVIKTT